MKERRRMLRHNMTEAEALLWSVLKNKQILGQRFLRQFSINSYVVDFYCPKIKLAVEVDGKSHQGKEAKVYDRDREEQIGFAKVKFLRFTNDEIFQNIIRVIKIIKKKIRELEKLK